MTVLVTYATRTGSTVEVAQAIAQGLAEKGLPAQARPMAEVTDLSPYRAVVAGSAIQGRRWLPEAMRFLEANREGLTQKPFAAFLVCMTLAMAKGERYRPQVAQWLSPVRALVPTVSEGLFCGRLDLRTVPGFGARLQFRLSVLAGVWSEGDHRDWAAVRTWTESLPALLAR